MKKLKLYGKKKIFLGFRLKGFVADVYVHDGKVLVYSKNRKLRDELQKEINERIEKDLIYRGRGIWEEKDGKRIHYDILETQRPKDTYFLETLLKGYSAFWNEKTFGGYVILNTFSKIEEK